MDSFGSAYSSLEALGIVVVVMLGWIASVCLHEFGHAIVAYRCGDYSVKQKGYLTLNPLRYTHPVVSIVFPLMFLAMGGIPLPGGAVYIDRSALRYRWQSSFVSAAGPMATAAFTIVIASPFWLGLVPPAPTVFGENPNWFWSALSLLVLLEMAAIVLNLLPIPALDGFGILRPWLPPDIQAQVAPIERYGLFILLGLFWFYPPFSSAFWQLAAYMTVFIGASPAMALDIYPTFHGAIRGVVVLAIVIGIIIAQIHKNR